MKIWLLAIALVLSCTAWGQIADVIDLPEDIDGWQGPSAGDPNEPPADWMDTSHSYATDRAQALTEWMDSYFGEPNYELEQAESLLRLDFISDWDQDDGINNKVRLRGKIQLPRLSKRLNLVFSDEQGDEVDPDYRERKLDDNFGLLYRVSESKHSRFDLTMGISWNHVRPGVRYRYQGALDDVSTYRFTQRLQYENSEGGYATSQIELNRVLDENTVLRWNNRGVYGEETDGVEWISRVSLFQRNRTISRKHVLGINYFGSVNGLTDPSYIKNYRLGVLFRRQVYREYLFLELEPAYNYRKQNPEDKRQFAWSVALRLQVALERDLSRKKKKKGKESAPYDPTGQEPLLSPEEKESLQQPAAGSLEDEADL